MTGLTALIAGQGRLPRIVADSLSAAGQRFIAAELDGQVSELSALSPVRFRIERLAPFLDHLAQSGVSRVVFAGAVRRPERLEPELFDGRTATLVPRLLSAMQSGDDAALRAVIAIFEDWDLPVVGVQDIAPDLVPEAGVLAGTLALRDEADATRAASIVAALGAVDVGQGAVVAEGLCLAVEALPGTDAMLAAVAGWRAGRETALGLLYKAPKPGQDLRVDLPAIGPDTVAGAARAGLAGIAWQAGGAVLLDRAATLDAARKAGLFLWSRSP